MTGLLCEPIFWIRITDSEKEEIVACPTSSQRCLAERTYDKNNLTTCFWSRQRMFEQFTLQTIIWFTHNGKEIVLEKPLECD